MKRLSPTCVAGAAGLMLALSAAAPAVAADWWYVAASKDGVTFMDRASATATRAAGRTAIRVWFAVFNSAPDRDGVKSRKVQAYLDCQDRSMASRSYIGYAADGSVKAQDSIDEYAMEWTPVAPGTVGEAQLLLACNARQIADDAAEFEIEGIGFFHVDDLDAAARRLTPSPGRVAPNSAGKRG